ncbi:MAG: heparinase II/III family protein [Acidobacteria bacterium]|nr:heparinase II/III family protein [Acidobacteriota bacterium]
MGIRKRCSLLFILLAAAFPSALSGEESGPDPARLRRSLQESNKDLAWNLRDGYAAEGRFILKATGEELEYRARFARAAGRWAADFTHQNRSRNTRYVLSGGQAWISSPEITLDILPARLPYMARFDYFVLYEELLGILKEGKRNPRFALEKEQTEIYVRGRLGNGWEAVFILNAARCMPRKVLITMAGEPSDSWLFAFSQPDGAGYASGPSSQATNFEIWFSDPLETGECTYPRRMDFVESGNVVGTYFLEQITAFGKGDSLFIRPPRFPWAEKADPVARAQSPESSLYINAAEKAALRKRIREEPWREWNTSSRMIALWAKTALWIEPVVPGNPPAETVAAAVSIGFLFFVFLLVCRSRRFNGKFSWRLFAAGISAGCLILASGIASQHLGSPSDRSLFALHSAIRYSATGDSSHAETCMDLLDGLAGAPAESMEELGRSSQAYALAYALIRREVPRRQRLEIERRLFDCAAPLFGAAHGWISNLSQSSAVAAGLGMTGLAIGCEPFVTAADETMRRTLESQFTRGLHRWGPGPGCMAMDSAVNLFDWLKRAQRSDYYAYPALREYIRSALDMISPVGTLPLFGDTNLDQSSELSMLFLKTANQLPPEEESACVAAHRRYWQYNTHRAGGLKRWILPSLEPFKAYYRNPYAMLQYAKPASGGRLPSASAVLGSGQAAILRSGGSADDLYLAINAPTSNPPSSGRDILTFDFYAYRALLLHGAGSQEKNNFHRAETERTAAGNSVTMNNESQAGTKSSGIGTALLNRPVFDYVRASADKTYDYGKFTREVVLVRPEKGRPGYFLLVDTVSVSNPETTIQWHLHGSGDLASGVGQQTRWTAFPFSASRTRSGSVALEVSFPTGFMGNLTTGSGTLYSRTPSLNRESRGISIEWAGSRRFVASLFPYISDNPPEIKQLSSRTGRIGIADWVSIGERKLRITAGPLTHVSDLTVVRDRGGDFPALLIISGIEFRFGAHSLAGIKPFTASLDGLRGVWVNSRPDTLVEIRSPDIKAGDSFILGGGTVTASHSGLLTVRLESPGEHHFRRAP